MDTRWQVCTRKKTYRSAAKARREEQRMRKVLAPVWIEKTKRMAQMHQVSMVWIEVEAVKEDVWSMAERPGIGY